MTPIRGQRPNRGKRGTPANKQTGVVGAPEPSVVFLLEGSVDRTDLAKLQVMANSKVNYMYYQNHGHSKTFDQLFIFRRRCVLLSR